MRAENTSPLPDPQTWGALPALIAEYEADRQSIQRLFDAPWSRECRQRLVRLTERWEDRLSALPWESLCPSDRVDAWLLALHLESEARRLKDEEKRWEELARSVPSLDDLVALLDERRLLRDVEPASAAERLHDAWQSLERLEQSGDPDLPTGVAVRLVRTLRNLKKALEGWHTFHCGYDPLFTWWVQKPWEALAARLDAAADRVEAAHGLAEGAPAGDPVGRDVLLEQLDAALIPYTPEELIALAEQEQTWCIAQMETAAEEMGLGRDRRAALEQIKADCVPPGQQPRLVRDLAREAVAFVEHLVTVPEDARDAWRMEMMSPERQKVNPFFLGGECIVVSYPTADMPHAEKVMSMRGNNRHFARATVQHELVPGHFLQHYSQARRRPYRRLFHTPFWTEGWALYWEIRLWELGFPRTPEERIGMLFWRLHRAARVVFSLRFHMGQMSAADCVEMLVDLVGHERSTAEGEVRRSFGGDYPPLYQCAYLIGGMQFRALHREMVERGGMAERAFHDAVLRENCVPVAALRAVLRGDAFERGFRPHWRFAEA